ncbi:ectoine/hydroxyectoine ABC transporter permease subunit EhuC [Bosea sp. (in: a-proteobacteria)]|uniref:ectoine/hydroxyectoine ABC transporter permease subunit EhuC n=1 Tax=Bosea sp. (in: a-proteobacteria) TaxID=1871050 RepID=UPI002629CE7F|nr:ectoine/hydroxyectoine ABC transporter permease subunit EhuC [Bosea sp. (in: a-proteobacteria)]MCO5089532.1 ectoine/hydroxyectoine ABC transporter permease subunit EhuC [Bosea sp. (in: a-proteobacteria)]
MPAYLPNLLGGIGVTAQIAVLSALVAFLLASIFGVMRGSARRSLAILAIIYIEFFRGTSLLVQLFWLYFVLPQFGVSWPPLWVAVIGIGLNYGAYGAEIVRAALASVAKGQREAAHALGLTGLQCLRLVIVPQALVIFIRPWGNLMIQLLKATSLVSLITIADLTYRAYQLTQLTMQTMQIMGLVLLIYFVLAQIIAAAVSFADLRVGTWRRVRAGDG